MVQPVQNDGCFWDYIREGEPSRAYGTAYWDKDGVKATEDLKGD